MHLLLLLCLSVTCSSTSSYTTDNDWWSVKMNKSYLLNGTSTINGVDRRRIQYFSLVISKNITSSTSAARDNDPKASSSIKGAIMNMVPSFFRGNKASSTQSPPQTPRKRLSHATIWNSTNGQSPNAGIIIQFNHPKIPHTFDFKQKHNFTLFACLWYNQMKSFRLVQFVFVSREISHDTNLIKYSVYVTMDGHRLRGDGLRISYKPGQHIHILLQQNSIGVGSNSNTTHISSLSYRCKWFFYNTVSAISFQDSLQYVTWIQYTTVPSELHLTPEQKQTS